MQSLPEMDEQQFLKWQDLLESRTGVELTFNRKTFLQTSLGIRMREIGCKDYSEYYEKIVTGPDAAMEWATLVDRLTVHETRFFRDPDAFREVKKFIQARILGITSGQCLNIWSVGCATGEEPYGLAMLAHECFEQHNEPNLYRVMGSDISQPVLDTARKGVYFDRKLNILDQPRREKYFKPKGKHHSQVVSFIKENLYFDRLNVLELDRAPIHGMDVIFCQNLLIYFRQWRREEIVNELVDRLAPGGLLVLGVGEMVKWHHPLLNRVESIDTLMYTRCDES